MPRKEGNMMVRTLAAAFATTCLVAFATPVAAQTREFNVPAGTLRSALDSFARQSGRQVIYRGDEVRSVKSEGVRGVHTADSALDRLLAGTGFTARKDASGAFAVVKVGNLSAAAEASAASEEDAAEIVVTATKRPERVRDVPFAITVVDAANLTKRGEVRLQDISARIPGLQTPDQSNGGAQTSIVIRGLSGSGAGNPTSAVYVDDTPINASTFFGFGTSVPDLDPGDLARIEVLKGPQGTLYGATSIGGLIKYVSRDPDVRSIEAEAQAGLTSVAEGGEGYSLRARVNVPLSQQAAISVSGFTRRDPGFFDNLANNGRDFNRADNYGGRAALYAEVADNVRLRASVIHQTQKVSGFPTVLVDNATGEAFYDGLTTSQVPGGNQSRSFTTIANATLDADLSGAKLTSVTSYVWRDFRSSLDSTPDLGGTLTAFFGLQNPGPLIDTDVSNRKFVQELRATSDTNGAVSWQAGLFYTHESSEFAQALLVKDGLTGEDLPVALPTLLTARAVSTYREVAGFATLTLKLDEAFDIEGGLRYSHSTQRADEAKDGLLAGGQSESSGKMSANKLTYSINPRFRLNSQIMIYARLASGFRPGGVNVGQTGENASYNTDSVMNYEVGLKGDLIPRLLTIDVSGFFVDWRGIQLLASDPVTGINFYRNGGRARSKGVEASVLLTPTRGFTLDGNVAYTDAYLRDPFSIAGATSPAGAPLPFSPRWAYHLGGDYRAELGGGWTGRAGIAYRYVGKRESYFPQAAGYSRLDIPSYDTVDLTAGVETGRFSLDAFVRNISDRRGVSSGQVGATVTRLSIIQPRTFGISATVRY